MGITPSHMKTKLMIRYWRYLPKLGTSLTKILDLLFAEVEELYHAYDEFPVFGLKKVCNLLSIEYSW